MEDDEENEGGPLVEFNSDVDRLGTTVERIMGKVSPTARGWSYIDIGIEVSKHGSDNSSGAITLLPEIFITEVNSTPHHFASV